LWVLFRQIRRIRLSDGDKRAERREFEGLTIELRHETAYLLNRVETSSYAIGQAVFIRTDTPDFAEETVPFQTLDELVRICATPRENMTLDKVVMYSMVEGEPHSLMLSFLSASKGQVPGMPVFEERE
jgi:hypothetical protein